MNIAKYTDYVPQENQYTISLAILIFGKEISPGRRYMSNPEVI